MPESGQYFFIPLGFRYGSDKYPYSHLGSIYGPYSSREAVDEALRRGWPNDKREQFLVFTGEIAMVKPSYLEKPESEKREPGNFDNYVLQPDGSYKCKDCNGDIIGAPVAHSIHVKGLGSLAGTGEVERSTMPYCPNCEHKPNFHGAPLTARF